MERLNVTLVDRHVGLGLPGRVIPVIRGLPENMRQYPSDWFLANNHKPIVHLTTGTNIRQAFTDSLYAFGPNREIYINSIADFMVCYIQNHLVSFSKNVTENWTTFGQLIGNVGDVVTPLSLIRLVEQPRNEARDQQNEDQMTPVQERSWFWALVAGYRLSRITQGPNNLDYVNQLNERIRGIFSEHPYNRLLELWELIRPNVGRFIRLTEYAKLISALDMFYSRYPELDFSSYRDSTMTARNRGCVVVTGLNYIMKLANCDGYNVLKYVMDSSIERELAGALRQDQEVDVLGSYAPYLIEFGLSKKSPYSSGQCPGFHLWLHTIGCVMGSSRSKNATYVDTTSMAKIINAGAIAGLMMNERQTQKRRIVLTEADRVALLQAEDLVREQREAEAMQMAADGLPQENPGGSLGGCTPEDLEALLSGPMPGDVRDLIRARIAHCYDARHNTVGMAVMAAFYTLQERNQMNIRDAR